MSGERGEHQPRSVTGANGSWGGLARAQGDAREATNLPLFTLKGIPLAFAVALLLCWPVWVTGAVYKFPDSNGYYEGGKAIWSIVANQLPDFSRAADGGGGGGDGASAPNLVSDDEGPRYARSLFYPAVVYPLIAAGGPLALALFQGTFSVFAAFALVDRTALRSPWILVAGGLACIAFSTLPWHAVYQMPDVLSATMLIFAATIVGTFHRMTTMQRVTITAMAAFAAGAHYGNMLLILGLAVVAALGALYQRRLTPFAAIALVIVASITPVTNMIASRMFLEEASAAPLRMPVLLARFLQDGTAVRFLEENCPESGYAMCTAFDGRIPEGIDEFLWASDGIQSLDDETLARIREEEVPLVKEVLLTYPLHQTGILLWNGWRQLTGSGTDQIFPMQTWEGNDLHIEGFELIQWFDDVTPVFTHIATVILALLVLTGRLPEHLRMPLAVIVLGVLGNALIFGGLSSPADRYQSRLIWVIPVFAVIALATIHGSRKSSDETEPTP